MTKTILTGHQGGEHVNGPGYCDCESGPQGLYQFQGLPHCGYCEKVYPPESMDNPRRDRQLDAIAKVLMDLYGPTVYLSDGEGHSVGLGDYRDDAKDILKAIADA